MRPNYEPMLTSEIRGKRASIQIDKKGRITLEGFYPEPGMDIYSYGINSNEIILAAIIYVLDVHTRKMWLDGDRKHIILSSIGKQTKGFAEGTMAPPVKRSFEELDPIISKKMDSLIGELEK